MPDNLTTLANRLGQALLQQNLRLATAESCTGGGLGYWLTSVPGSSDWYDRGFITYSNTAKMQMLQVKPETLDQFGAVSEETAREMAEGALLNSTADLSISITGIAGPGGGTEQKPVGTVWMGFAGRPITTEAHLKHFTGDREAVRLAVIHQVIAHLTNLVSPNETSQG